MASGTIICSSAKPWALIRLGIKGRQRGKIHGRVPHPLERGTDASQIYATDVEGEIRGRAQGFRDTWETREPQAVAAFFHDFEQTLSYLTVDFPRAYVSLIRTTNLLERFHKEIRRKQRDIGMLQSEAGGNVLWYMVAMRETAKQRASCRGKG